MTRRATALDRGEGGGRARRGNRVVDAPVLRGSGVALWRQIAEQIEADIAAAGLAAGSPLPTEAELSERFRVNRHTVRRALGVLAERGLIRTAQGIGSFVEEPPLRYPITARVRFSEIVRAEGRQPRGQLIGVATVTEAEPAARLRLPPRTALIRVELVSSANGVPVSLSTSWFCRARFGDLAAEVSRTGSITRGLAACGVSDYVRAETLISARAADRAECRLLDVAEGRTVLVVDAVNADADGVPIQVQRTRFVADRVRLAVGP